MSDDQPTLHQAKARLDQIISKARVDLYKPIQIAEVLYHARTEASVDPLNIESYRNASKHWRDQVTTRLTSKVSTSSARYQDDIWNANAMPPTYLKLLDADNRQLNGAVERYIYLAYELRQNTVGSIIAFIQAAVSAPPSFQLAELLNLFIKTAGLARSIDKAYEIVVYSLLETLITHLQAQVIVTIPPANHELLREFSDLTSSLLGLDASRLSATAPAHIYRVGVTNAADRGIDMWANFGPAIQVKHMTLDEQLASKIINQIDQEHDNIIIVCRDADVKVLETVMQQISWGRRVRAIVKQSQLEQWYDRCLRGTFAPQLGKPLLERLLDSFVAEFPQTSTFQTFFAERGYSQIAAAPMWIISRTN